jgi:hypothetical protein
VSLCTHPFIGSSKHWSSHLSLCSSFAAAAAVCNLEVCLLGLRSVFTSVELGEREVEEEARAELLSWV